MLGPTAGNLPRGLDGDLLKKEVMKQVSKHLEVYLDWRWCRLPTIPFPFGSCGGPRYKAEILLGLQIKTASMPHPTQTWYRGDGSDALEPKWWKQSYHTAAEIKHFNVTSILKAMLASSSPGRTWRLVRHGYYWFCSALRYDKKVNYT